MFTSHGAPRGVRTCTTCGGTLLPPSISGAERGSCHCPRGPGRIWTRPFGYEVEWFGDFIPVEPPTLAAAVAHLTMLRAAWRAGQAEVPMRVACAFYPC
jgi:hypothetical protein